MQTVTYTVDLNEFFVFTMDSTIKEAIQAQLLSTATVLSAERPSWTQYYTVIVQQSTGATEAVQSAILMAAASLGYDSAVILRTEAGATSTNVLKEAAIGAADSLAPLARPLGSYVLKVLAVVAFILALILILKGGNE